MKKAIKIHFELIKKHTKIYNGKIIKTIGDAHMIVFSSKNSLKQAIAFSTHTQSIHHALPIYIDHNKNHSLEFRIGFAYGKVHPTKSVIQGCLLRDYIGSTVNIASRMESKLSNKHGFAFYSSKNVDKELLQVLNKIGKVETVIVSKKCFLQKNKLKRSGVLLSPQCLHPKHLKGVGELTAYRITLRL